MRQRTFGHTGLLVSELGFGGSEIGFRGVAQAEVDSMLNAALDAGVTVFDTAECYLDSEEKIGRAIGSRRAEFRLFTKVGHEHGWSRGEDYSAPAIARTIDRSLSRLRTEVLDLVQLHSCKAEVLRRGECIEALRAARAAGKVRFIGYSGDGDDALFAVRTGAFDALQTSINLADQRVLDDVLPEAARRGMGVIAKRPIANAAWLRPSVPQSDYAHEYWNRLRELRFPLLDGPPEETAAAALRFTLSQPGVHAVIVGTTRVERSAANARAAARGPLPPDELAAVRARWREVAPASWVGQV